MSDQDFIDARIGELSAILDKIGSSIAKAMEHASQKGCSTNSKIVAASLISASTVLYPSVGGAAMAHCDGNTEAAKALVDEMAQQWSSALNDLVGRYLKA